MYWIFSDFQVFRFDSLCASVILAPKPKIWYYVTWNPTKIRSMIYDIDIFRVKFVVVSVADHTHSMIYCPEPGNWRFCESQLLHCRHRSSCRLHFVVGFVSNRHLERYCEQQKHVRVTNCCWAHSLWFDVGKDAIGLLDIYWFIRHLLSLRYFLILRTRRLFQQWGKKFELWHLCGERFGASISFRKNKSGSFRAFSKFSISPTFSLSQAHLLEEQRLH